VGNFLIFEINDKSLKALWGRNVLRDTQIVGCVVERLDTSSEEELFKVISSIIIKRKLQKYKPLIVCLPRHRVTLRNLRFPSTDDKELENIVKLNLVQQVPYAKEDIIYSYLTLWKTSKGFSSVLLGIVHKEVLRKQFYIFERLNLYPENVLISTMGLMEFLRKAKIARAQDTIVKAYLDVDTEFSDFLIFKGHTVLFSKSISMGSVQLKIPDLLPRFVAEIKQALLGYKSVETRSRENLSRIYISGATSGVHQLPRLLSSEFRLPADIIKPFTTVNTLGALKALEDLSSGTSINMLLGVASEPLSKKLSLILPEAKFKRDVQDLAKNLIVMGSIICYITLLIIFGFIGKIYMRQGYADRLGREVQLLETKNKPATTALDKIKAIRKFSKQKDSFLYYYYKLAEIIPRNITIDRTIFAKGDEFALMGKGTDMGEIFKFVTVLSDAGIFGKTELRYSRKKTKGKKEFNEFEIVCHLK